MDQVITFDKSLQQRLQEYERVLEGYEILPVSSIHKEWAFYLELTLEPNGWQAIWKIQRKTCEALNIAFPSLVLVIVLSVDLQDLTALVRVLAVQDDIHLPEKHQVPLVNLWPTRDQDKSIVLDLEQTANVLDMLRFFYNNILMPWDYEEDDTVDWKGKHLESRLRMYYDVKLGVIPRGAADRLQALISEAKRLQFKREALESDLVDVDELGESIPDISGNDKVQALMEIHVRMMHIKVEVDILENPFLRKAVINRDKTAVGNNDETKQNIWVVFKKTTATNSISFLTKIAKEHPDDELNPTSDVFAILEWANPGDVFILSEGEHEIKRTGALESGGVMKGVSNRDNTVLTSTVDDVMLDFKGDSVLLQNLTIKAFSPKCAVIVRSGELMLRNCKLVGDGKSSTHQGIIVLNGGSLRVVDCDISNFYTAIVGNSGAKITLENSEIHDCNIGCQLFDNCTFTAAKAIIRNCRSFGICVETENNLDCNESRVGDFNTLNIIPTLQMDLLMGNNNVKGDAAINHKPKLQFMADVFKSELDSSLDQDEDDEMDEDQQNCTVIENGRASPATV